MSHLKPDFNVYKMEKNSFTFYSFSVFFLTSLIVYNRSVVPSIFKWSDPPSNFSSIRGLPSTNLLQTHKILRAASHPTTNRLHRQFSYRRCLLLRRPTPFARFSSTLSFLLSSPTRLLIIRTRPNQFPFVFPATSVAPKLLLVDVHSVRHPLTSPGRSILHSLSRRPTLGSAHRCWDVKRKRFRYASRHENITFARRILGASRPVGVP